MPKELFQIKFSLNIIKFNISGLGLLNFFFYNLFNIINVLDITEKQYIINFIKNLIKQYI